MRSPIKSPVAPRIIIAVSLITAADCTWTTARVRTAVDPAVTKCEVLNVPANLFLSIGMQREKV